MPRHPLFAIALGLGLATSARVSAESGLRAFADHLGVRYQVIDNRPDGQCRPDAGDGRCFQAELRLTPDRDWPEKTWAIYFSQISPIQPLTDPRFIIDHLNGDLHRLRPGPAFPGWRAGETLSLRYRAAYWSVSNYDAMPNFYLVTPNQKPALIASTRPVHDPDTGLERLPFVVPLGDGPGQFLRSDDDAMVRADARTLFARPSPEFLPAASVAADLIPHPQSLELEAGQPPLFLGAGLNVRLQGFAPAGLAAGFQHLASLGVAASDTGVPLTVLKAPGISGGPEAYRLDISQDGITIRASDAAGAFYGLQSLAGLLDLKTLQVPALTIADAPRYPFRGLHVDVARNFHDQAELLKILDQMAAYKLNKLHLHLADDEGWRLEIPGLPELTAIGSRRCHDPQERTCLSPQLGAGPDDHSARDGYFRTGDYIDLLKAAQARHIEVIPSLDMPGHARAAVVAMRERARRLLAAGKPEAAGEYRLDEPGDTSAYESVQFYHDNTINVCLPSSYHFIDKIISEVKRLHARAGVPLTRFHIGADETAGAWIGSPACQALMRQHPELNTSKALGARFLEQVATLVAGKGLVVAGWSDGLADTDPEKMPKSVQANAWTPLFWNGHEVAERLANQGWQVVLSLPDVSYFDFPYEADPDERGYYWGSRATNERKVFEFMPDNLPAMAEIWNDRENRPMVLDDRPRDGHHPLAPGRHYAGLQAQLWSETVRDDGSVEYLLFPRLLALAERAWHRADWELPYDPTGVRYSRDSHHFGDVRRAARDADWQRFVNVLGRKELLKLDKAGIRYRVPPAGARIEDGRLQITTPFPGLAVEYRVGQGPWTVYREPVKLSTAHADGAGVEVRARAADGGRPGRALPVIPGKR